LQGDVSPKVDSKCESVVVFIAVAVCASAIFLFLEFLFLAFAFFAVVSFTVWHGALEHCKTGLKRAGSWASLNLFEESVEMISISLLLH